jgi:hypothetical protein
VTPLAFVQAAPALVVLLIDALIWLLFGQLVVFPWIEEQMGGSQPWWKRVALKPVQFIERRAKRLVERLKSDAANRFALSSPSIARWLHRNALILEQLSGVVVASNEATFKAFNTLRRTTIPTLIAQALQPIKLRLGQAEALVRGVADTLTAVSVEFADGLRALPWGVPAGLPQRVSTFFVTYKRLWDKVWDELAPRVTALWTQIVPELRQRLDALEKGAGGGIGQALQALRNRVTALENQAGNIILPRLDNLEDAVAALSREVFGEIGTGLLELVGRVATIEAWLVDTATPALAELELGLAQLRLELEQGVETGLEVLRQRFEALELEVFTAIPQRFAALELSVETLVAEAIGYIGAGLVALTQRIVALEQDIQNRILPGFDLIIGRITALEERIENAILPRITALEGLLAPAAFAALVLATMRIVAPNLFCRNVTSTSKAICAQDEAMWAELLAGTLLFALVLDPRVIARAGQEVMEGMEVIWRETALR